ncbi:MAG: endonuclease/exonuclease/phosphatase family protein [Blastocatellia bacterium]
MIEWVRKKQQLIGSLGLLSSSKEDLEGLLSDDQQVRVVSLNAHCGKKLERIIDELQKPRLALGDVILLQEVEEKLRLNQTELLANRLGYHACYLPARLTRRGTHGLAILSRYPMTDIEILPLPRYERLIKTRSRVAMGATILVGSEKLRVYNVHLDTHINALKRREQLYPVISASNEHYHIPTIIAGDFNTFRPRHTSYLDEMLADAGFFSPFLFGSHYTAKFLFWRPQLDWIYTRNLQITRANVEQESTCSDHRPLWADAVLPSSEVSLLSR